MKVSFYFAFHELRRRLRRTLSMLLVSAAILTALNMLLFYFDASWRAEVMPEKETNYHFDVREPTTAERAHIISQPWVQAYYDVDVENHFGEFQYYELRVRVDWDNVLRSNALARDIFDQFDLYHSEQYIESYERIQELVRSSMTSSWKPWETSRGGMTFDQWLVHNTKESFIRIEVQNASFCRLTVDSYIIRPEFAMYMQLFACFLGSTMAILFSEQYRQNLSQFGTMRAFGMKKRQIVFINCIETFLINLFAVPVSWIVTGIVTTLYNLCTKKLNDGTVYLNLGETLPFGAMIVVALMMVSVSVLGCLAVCMLYNNRTIMELLRGIEKNSVSFVSKTSPRFEKAQNLAIYDRLYLTRTRVSFALNTLVLALMLPLPLWYFTLCLTMIGQNLSGGEWLIAIYHIVQAVLLFATSITVTFVAVRQSADSRSHEFAILRAVGCKKQSIRRRATVQAAIKASITAILAAIFFLIMSDTRPHISSMPTGDAVSIFVILSQIAIAVLGGAVLILPPTFGGIARSLRRFFKRSTIVNLLEFEN